MPRLLAPLCALFFTSALFAQTPYLVKDINSSGEPTIRDSSPSNFVADGETVYFSATTSYEGELLWKVVGGQASLVKDTIPHVPSAPSPVVPIGGGVSLFTGWTYAGVELWRTDGTAAGTVLLKDTNPSGNGQVAIAGVFNGLAYLQATTQANGREVWVSDGTEAGTHLLKDLNGTSTGSNAFIIGALGSRVVLTGVGGLWITDGTEAGTSLIKGGISPRGAVVVGSKIFFAATDPTYGEELWTSDGTEAGTQRALEMNPTTASSLPGQAVIVPAGAGVIFYGTDGTGGNSGLWSSDGTSAGTLFLTTELATYCGPACRYNYFAVANGLAYFNTQTKLWRTDGTLAGTYPIDMRAAITPFEAFSSTYYVVTDASGNTFLRRTDGTIGGTTTTMTFPTSSAFGSPAFTGGKLYFRQKDHSVGSEPWVSTDGVTASLLANVNGDQAPSSSPTGLTAVGDRVFFGARENLRMELWRSDGSSAGTLKMTNFAADGTDDFTGAPLSFGGASYFLRYGQVWKSDGTAAGTGPANLFAGEGAQPQVTGLYSMPDHLYLTTSSGLWVSDGTAAGAQRLAPDSFVADRLTSAGTFVELAGTVYFVTSMSSPLLWRTNGTSATTREIAQFNGGSLKPAGGALYFVTGDSSAQELWRSDGTPEGGVSLGQFLSVEIDSITTAGRNVYFVADDGNPGYALWRTNGTVAGTIRLRGLEGRPSYWTPPSLTAVGDTLFFVADDVVYGTELWRSDGTPEGTILAKDIAPGVSPSTPASLLAVDGELWFVANDGPHGAELWRSDGTEAGTFMVADLAPGVRPSSPKELVKAGRRIFFSADDGATGFEPWAVNLTGCSLSIGDARRVEGNAGTGILRFTVMREGDLTQPASVSFATEDGTATGGSDYTAIGGSLTFLAGETSKTIDVVISGDTANEQEESFFVVLSSVAGAALARNRATGVIQNDDQRVDLAVTIATTAVNAQRAFNVTNKGPSTATGVQLRITESPAVVPFRTLDLPPIAPGTTAVAGYSRAQTPNPLILDYDLKPGYTVTATVTSTEPELDAGDNTQSRMMNEQCSLLLPPFVEVSTSAAGKVFVSGDVRFTTDALLTITPASIPSASPSYEAPITVQGGATPGRSTVTVTAGYSASTFVYPVVAAGQTAKLDTALSIVAPTGTYGLPLQFQAFIHGARPNGALPTGMVTFKDNGGGVIAQAALDANAGVTLTRSGLNAGTWPHWIEYSGDGSFNPMRGRFNLSFTTAPTVTSGTLTRTSCYVAEGRITVKAASGTAAPEGKITVGVGGNSLAAFTLAPTGQPGEASAVVRIQLPGKNNALEFWYSPGTFSNYTFSSTAQTIAFADCAGMGTALYTMTPCRILDTRNSTGPFGGPALGVVAERTVQIAGRCGVSATAKAVTVNVTVVNPTTTAFLRLLPSGVLPRSSFTSTVSYRIGKTRAMNTIINLNSDGAIDVYNPGSAAVHFIIDVYGYFQ